MDSLEKFATSKLAELEAQHLRRWLAQTDRTDNAIAVRNGRRLISFCCNDYLNLSQHPQVKQAAIDATQRLGAGAGASRLVSGNHSLYRELETALARLKGTQDACVFGSGYLANLGIIPALAGPGDLILADALSHACLMAGGKLSNAETIIFRHNDMAHLAELLGARRHQYRHCLILTDGVFSMDGDLAPVQELADTARKFDAWLMTDDAHGVGVLADGRGSSFVQGENPMCPCRWALCPRPWGSMAVMCARQRPSSI